jgi:hypothetical protein
MKEFEMLGSCAREVEEAISGRVKIVLARASAGKRELVSNDSGSS